MNTVDSVLQIIKEQIESPIFWGLMIVVLGVLLWLLRSKLPVLPRKILNAFVCGIIAIIYVVSPIDIVPDLIPIIGWIDDVLILYGAYFAFRNVYEEFLKLNIVPAWAIRLIKNIKSKADLSYSHIVANPILTSFFFLIILYSFLYATFSKLIDYTDEEFLKNIVVEYHGMLLDIIVFGILIAVFNKAGERKKEIQKYLEEIDDYRHWKEPEAKFRIRGNIIRLNNLNHTKFDLSFIDLSNIKMLEVKFNSSNLTNTNFSSTNLNKAKFSNIVSSGSNFNSCFINQGVFIDSHLQYNTFKKAILLESNWSNSTLSSIDFANADLRGAVFNNTYMYDPNFEGAIVSEDFIDNLKKSKISGHPVYDMYFVEKKEVGGHPGHFEYIAHKKTNYSEFLSKLIEKK